MGRAPVGHNRGMQKVLEDQQLGAAIELAREAAVIEAEAAYVGEHLEMAMEDERLATHLFTCLHPGYVGWHWAVTVARAPEQTEVTVCDVVLLPGATALVPRLGCPGVSGCCPVIYGSAMCLSLRPTIYGW